MGSVVHGGLDLNLMLSHFRVEFFSCSSCGMIAFNGVEVFG
jgi:hypothetical protein